MPAKNSMCEMLGKLAEAGGREMTNIEYLLSATEEQLEERLEELSRDCPPGARWLKCPGGSCTKCWERWLQEEREE